MSKRKSLCALNSDNWDVEDVPEEKGTFQKASEDELKNRVIRTAFRRTVSTTKSTGLFSGFEGFSKTTSVNSLFSALCKTTSSPVVTSASNLPKSSEEFSPREKQEMLADLNKSILDRIKTRIEENPFAILTPIFEDYEKQLKKIKSNEKTPSEASSTSSDAKGN
ncbi:nuclear pore complex protein Nup50-like [Phlebotomus argentipes]|uniref:nuclear pore complex protein Nup50-like n=1 Tax=Phlebotomus argentipes TaxID=94469 RepID=UPI0028934BB8|nr:nuclear pore complex protein Nup50-like [Phlebotomus argentipes]